MTDSRTVLWFFTIMVLRITGQVFCTMSSIGIRLMLYICGRKTTEVKPVSFHHIKGTSYQHDLPLLMLTLIPWLRRYLLSFSSIKLFPPLSTLCSTVIIISRNFIFCQTYFHFLFKLLWKNSFRLLRSHSCLFGDLSSGSCRSVFSGGLSPVVLTKEPLNGHRGHLHALRST